MKADNTPNADCPVIRLQEQGRPPPVSGQERHTGCSITVENMAFLLAAKDAGHWSVCNGRFIALNWLIQLIAGALLGRCLYNGITGSEAHFLGFVNNVSRNRR